MNLFRRATHGGPALLPDVLEALTVTDTLVDGMRLTRALALRKLSSRGLPFDPGVRRHTVKVRSRGILFTLDVWAAEHRPLREIIARDEYGIVSNPLARGGVVIDVGANVGIFSLLAASQVGQDGRVLAFEPHPLAYQRLIENIRQNGYERSIHPVRAAVSNRHGTLSFDSASLSVEGVVSGGRGLAVDSVRLDDMDEIGTVDRVSMIKVDVEGHEIAVVDGGRRVFSRAQRIAIEYHSHTNRAALITLLRDLGFQALGETKYLPHLGLISAVRM